MKRGIGQSFVSNACLIAISDPRWRHLQLQVHTSHNVPQQTDRHPHWH